LQTAPEADSSFVQTATATAAADDAAAAPRTTELARGTGTATGAGNDLPNLDVLRAVAVSCVLGSHIVTAMRPTVINDNWFGGFGVALFFVHTALVLMWSLERRPNTLDFYVRRAARIYPLSMVVVLAVVATHAPVETYHEGGSFFVYLSPSYKQVLTHFFLVQNLFSDNFLIYPMWSLPVEVQMYVVLPALFFFVRSNRARWPLLLFWGVAAGFDHHIFGPQIVNLAVSIPYFLPGVIAYAGFSLTRAVLPGWSFVVALAAITWIGGHAGTWDRAWIPCLALGLLLPYFKQLRQGVFTKICWQIARYSYGIYLLHPFALVLAFYFCRNSARVVQFSVLFASLAILSVAAFHLIEAPFMRWGAKAAGAIAKRYPMPGAPC
jgi:peptidoglycan/LPS O-acetylase OafA/YrhL